MKGSIGTFYFWIAEGICIKALGSLSSQRPSCDTIHWVFKCHLALFVSSCGNWDFKKLAQEKDDTLVTATVMSNKLSFVSDPGDIVCSWHIFSYKRTRFKKKKKGVGEWIILDCYFEHKEMKSDFCICLHTNEESFDYHLKIQFLFKVHNG